MLLTIRCQSSMWRDQVARKGNSTLIQILKGRHKINPNKYKHFN